MTETSRDRPSAISAARLAGSSLPSSRSAELRPQASATRANSAAIFSRSARQSAFWPAFARVSRSNAQRREVVDVQVGASALELVRGAAERSRSSPSSTAARSSCTVSSPPDRNALTSSIDELFVVAGDVDESRADRRCRRSALRPLRSTGRLLELFTIGAAHEAIEHVLQPRDVERLGQIVIHAGFQAALERAHHRVGGERDDRRAPVRRLPARECAASLRGRP